MKFRSENPLRKLSKKQLEWLYTSNTFIKDKHFRRWITDAYCEKTNLKSLSDER